MQRLLIANRGEIALRMIRSAHDLGIRCVAVYATVDAGAPFVAAADIAVPLATEPPSRAYLDIPAILDAARRSGADAVHPGYGFLAENAAFARAVLDADLIWVGPSPEVIATMGDKLAAFDLVRSLGVPVLPQRPIDRSAGLEAVHREVGYPLLVKAAAGGGGKGMRRVDGPGELAGAVEAARAEAGRAFGDDRLFGERLLSPARHIEVQLLGDHQGQVRHLGERECSIQRRHQKIIEEAPASCLDDAVRHRLWDAAVAIGGAVRYQGAGTVEFLVSPDGELFFLEMNTRLQVEHPVTELVTGVDLVRQQLLVAMQEPVENPDPPAGGVAIEARLYAEDPDNDYLPSSGPLVLFDPPPGARVDAGVHRRDEVSPHFDPLLAKVVVHAPRRELAVRRLAQVLQDTRVHGVTTNRDLLVAILRHPAFLGGDTTTDFIQRHAPARVRRAPQEEVGVAAIAAAVAATTRPPDRRPRIPAGWRNTPWPEEPLRFRHGDDEIAVVLRWRGDGGLSGDVDGRAFTAAVRIDDPPRLHLVLDGVEHHLTLCRDEGQVWVHGVDGEVGLLEVPRFPVHAVELPHGGLTAPINGTVVEVYARQDDTVAAGDTLLVIEAMKMLQPVLAPHDGIVREVHVGEGATVAAGELLAVLDPVDQEVGGDA